MYFVEIMQLQKTAPHHVLHVTWFWIWCSDTYWTRFCCERYRCKLEVM